MSDEIKAVEEVSVIDRADAINKKMEENIKQQNELLKRQEELYSKQLLSGRAIGGSVVQSPPVESAKEYAEKVLAGKVKVK